MAAERLSMRKIKEALRLRAGGHSLREIGRSLVIAPSTVHEYSSRADRAGLGWPLPEHWGDADLEARLFPFLELAHFGERFTAFETSHPRVPAECPPGSVAAAVR